ncbi:hypothetical protein [Pseudonocardia sp. D17]|uniref:hypothetical protein n=1 Tax=Pseudonocardia sp. D17 TaxID=882661 RepID=UPI002B3EAF58|nr:hypothetical protein PSD17_55130 [Pseudonocardia sp. D17]
MAPVMTVRKVPVEVQAMGPLSPENRDEIAAWCHGKADETHLSAPGRGLELGVVIHTLEGDMRASYGDFVIRGVKGEFYPCKPDVFGETYEVIG